MIRRAVVRLERLILWMFGPTGPWVHVLLGGLAAGWAAIMVGNPAIFDSGMYGAIAWLPDTVWITVHVTIAALHAAGVARPGWRRLRAIACLGSAWTWIVLGLTFLIGNGMTPGFLVYGQLGLLAATAALWTAWHAEAA